MDKIKIEALAKSLNVEKSKIKKGYRKDTFLYEKEEYLVLEDNEAETLYEEYLNNYIDDCLEIPDDIRIYFDDEKWKREARINGNREGALASYDGYEDSETIDGIELFIYRIN